MTASSSSCISKEWVCTSWAQGPCRKTRWTFIVNYTIRPCCREITKSEKPERTFLSVSCFAPLSKHSSSLSTQWTAKTWTHFVSQSCPYNLTHNIYVFEKEQHLATDYTIRLEAQDMEEPGKETFSPARVKALGPKGAINDFDLVQSIYNPSGASLVTFRAADRRGRSVFFPTLPKWRLLLVSPLWYKGCNRDRSCPVLAALCRSSRKNLKHHRLVALKLTLHHDSDWQHRRNIAVLSFTYCVSQRPGVVFEKVSKHHFGHWFWGFPEVLMKLSTNLSTHRSCFYCIGESTAQMKKETPTLCKALWLRVLCRYTSSIVPFNFFFLFLFSPFSF